MTKLKLNLNSKDRTDPDYNENIKKVVLFVVIFRRYWGGILCRWLICKKTVLI